MFKSLSLKVIIFGFIFTFFSSFGQSFFLGLFNPSIRDALSITQGQFGTIYASATLLSSFLLIWVGKKIDDINIFKFAFFVTILLSFSCFFFSKISSIAFLFIAIFLMRFSGQGMMSHTATTTISRFFTKSRGKALSTSWFGLSAAEFMLPVLIVYLLTITSWQNLWIYISILVLIFLPITSFILVKNLNFESREETNQQEFNQKIKQWKRIEVLKDYRFYIVCLNMLAMPWIATGVFVYQSFITLRARIGFPVECGNSCLEVIAPRSTCITRTGSVLIVQRELTSITGNTCPLIFLKLISATDGLICGVRTRD